MKLHNRGWVHLLLRVASAILRKLLRFAAVVAFAILMTVYVLPFVIGIILIAWFVGKATLFRKDKY